MRYDSPSCGKINLCAGFAELCQKSVVIDVYAGMGKQVEGFLMDHLHFCE